MAFQFINIIVLAPVVCTILILLRRQLKARKLWLLIPLDAASAFVLVGVLFTIMTTTPNLSANPFLWKGVYAWHTLTIFGLLIEAVVASFLLRSAFMGLLTVLFTIGLHETLFFLFFEIRDSIMLGFGHFFTDWLQNGVFNLVLVAPSIPLFIYVRYDKVSYKWLLPVLFFYMAWLYGNFNVSTYSPWDGLSYVNSIPVAITEVLSWFTTSACVLLSIIFGLKAFNTKQKPSSA